MPHSILSLFVAFALFAEAAFAGSIEIHVGRNNLNPAWGAIFTADEAKRQHGLDPKDPGAWTPSELDIGALEPLLAPQLRILFNQQGRRPSRLWPGDYYRQYAGTTLNGERVIVVNGFHAHHVQEEIRGIPQGPCTIYGPESDGPVESICPAMPGKPADFWKKEWVDVSDGGCSYFHALFNVAKLKFEYVFCQGTA